VEDARTIVLSLIGRTSGAGMETVIRTEIVILGGGFGGAFTAQALGRRLRRRKDARVTLLSRNNYHLMTPLLFETGSGAVEPRQAVTPLRELLPRTRFIEAMVDRVVLDRRTVQAHHPTSGAQIEVAYDHLILALGGITERHRIPGSELAMEFKTLADALGVRSRIIDRFEQAVIERDPDRRRALLTFVVIGAGLVGVEFTGEMSAFVDRLRRWYALPSSDIQFHLVEAGPHLLPEMEPRVADYVKQVFTKRGIRMHIHVPVEGIDAHRVRLGNDESIESDTILLAAGVTSTPVIAELPVEKDRKQRVVTEPSMQVKGRPGVWALGDCAHIPDPKGQAYPQLAQHALREARALARNVVAAMQGRALQPFRYRSLGTLAMLGGLRGVGLVLGVRIHGALAWAVWRLNYLYRTPKWERKARLLVDWAFSLIFKPDDTELPVPVLREQRRPSPRLTEAPAMY
jgi:NADH dehydrogenase